jgi:hypothetical protein
MKNQNKLQNFYIVSLLKNHVVSIQLINEDEEVEEAIDAGDKEEDFLNDIETADNEIEAEEMYSEDDEEMDMGDPMDAAEDDLADEMMGDEEADEDDEDDGDEEEMPDEVEDAFVNVQDGLEELKAAFAELLDTAEEEGEDDDMEDMGDDEAEMDMDMGDEEMPMESEEQLEEAEEFGKAVSVDNADKAQSKDSLHTKKMKSDVELEGKPVDFSGTGEEKKVALPKDEMKTDKKNAAELRNVKG